MVHIPKIRQEDLVNPNPITILQRIREFILGKNKPDKITQFFFYFNFLCWSTFFFWSILGYFSLTFINNIEEAKKLREIIELRGAHLGISDLYGHFKTFLLYMIFTWIFVLFGIILLWRKKASYVFFYFGGLMLYPIFMWWFLNLSYMIEDVTMFDKVVYIALFAPMIIYHLFFLREKETAQIPEEKEV